MPEQQKPRRRRWWLPILMAAVVMTAIFVWWSTQLSPVARLRASGAPMSVEDLFPPDSPAEGNAAATLEAVFPDLESMPSAVYELAAVSGDRPLSESELALAGDLLASGEAVFAALDRAVDEAFYVPTAIQDFDQDFLDRVGTLRSLARLSRLRTLVAIAEGRADEAVASAVTTLKFARLVELEPTVTGRLVACAIQGMALFDVDSLATALAISDEDAAAIDALLAALEDRSSFVRTLESERVVSLERLGDLPMPVQLWERPGILRAFEAAIEQASLAGTGESFRDSSTSTLATLMLPALQGAFSVENRLAVQARCVRIRLALRNAPPETVPSADNLGLPASVLRDPFSNGQLIIEHRDATPEYQAGWWVYSVFDNHTDDGGKLDGISDVGFAPPPIPFDADAQ